MKGREWKGFSRVRVFQRGKIKFSDEPLGVLLQRPERCGCRRAGGGGGRGGGRGGGGGRWGGTTPQYLGQLSHGESGARPAEPGLGEAGGTAASPTVRRLTAVSESLTTLSLHSWYTEDSRHSSSRKMRYRLKNQSQNANVGIIGEGGSGAVRYRANQSSQGISAGLL